MKLGDTVSVEGEILSLMGTAGSNFVRLGNGNRLYLNNYRLKKLSDSHYVATEKIVQDYGFSVSIGKETFTDKFKAESIGLAKNKFALKLSVKLGVGINVIQNIFKDNLKVTT